MLSEPLFSLSTPLSSIRRSLPLAGLQADELIYANNSVVRWTANALVDARRFADLCVADDPAANAKALQLYRGNRAIELCREGYEVTQATNDFLGGIQAERLKKR